MRPDPAASLCQRSVSEHALEALASLGRAVLCGASLAIALATLSPVAWLWAAPYLWHLFLFLRHVNRALCARETLA